MENQQLSMGIIDDELYALEILEKYAKAAGNITIAFKSEDPRVGLELLKSNVPDVLLTDVKMPRLNGFDVAKEVYSLDLPVILVTAYQEYAVSAFDHEQVVDFLLKPFTLNRFKQALLKARNFHGRGYYLLKVGKTFEKLPYAQIVYLESKAEYVKIVMKEGWRMTKIRMENISGIMQPKGFLRIHRSFAINMKFIQKVTFTDIYLHDSTVLPIGKTYRKDVQRVFEMGN